MNYKNTTIAPMQMQRSHETIMHPIEGMRLLDGGDAEAAAKAAADKAAADKAAADKAAADKAAADKAAAEAAAKELEDKLKGLSDSEAKLLKENMAQKAKLREAEDAAKKAQEALKAYEGVDPTKIQELIAANKAAEEAKRKTEEDNLKKSGDFDRLKAMMAEQHKVELAAEKKAAADKEAALTAAQKTINELTVGAAFSASQFLAKETVLSPLAARPIFESHFDVVDGKVTAYNKPRGEADRTPLVNASGDALGFEEAIKKIVDARPDKTTLLRSGLKPGAGTGTTDVRTGGGEADGPRGMARIKSSLKAGALKKA